MITKKDLIKINQQFASGRISNTSSLDFALKQIQCSPHWYKNMCLLTRNVVIDQIFEDGNKRTAVAVIITYLELNNCEYNPDKISQLVIKIIKSKITNLETIGRLIHHGTK